MSSRHKTPLLGWHPPAELAEWVRAESGRQGVSVSALLSDAVEAYRGRPGGRCGHCGYKSQGGTPEARRDDLFDHLKKHPPRVITDMREIIPAAGVTDTDE